MMTKEKVFLHILGARPNFIKAAPILKAITKHNCRNEILHTGQHYDYGMSEQFFKEFLLPKPIYNLNIGSMSHGAQTGRMIEGIEKVLESNYFDYVIIYGDTNSTLAGGLAAIKLGFPIAHVEAGVRTGNTDSPEEINRKLCDHLATINFSPTILSHKNLKNEGINDSRNNFCGDVMYDMVLTTKLIKPLISLPDKYVLATIHRQENTDNKEFLNDIFLNLIKLSKNIDIVFPMHPRTKRKLEEINLYKKVINSLNIIEPLGYNNLLYIIKNSKIVISDSGGVPKEAAFLGIPSIYIGNKIIWSELYNQTWSYLLTLNNINNLLETYNLFKNIKGRKKLEGFGDGKASIKIADFLSKT
jgi:UDP-GlcNAc3NAcA epimerase